MKACYGGPKWAIERESTQKSKNPIYLKPSETGPQIKTLKKGLKAWFFLFHFLVAKF
jgi:hypothetical protein